MDKMKKRKSPVAVSFQTRCIVCGKEMEAFRKSKKTCSSKCRQKIRDHQKVKDWYLKQRRGELAEATKFMHRIKYLEKKQEYPDYWTNKKKREYNKRKEYYKKYRIEYEEQNKEKVQTTKKKYLASEQGKLQSQKDSRKRRERVRNVNRSFTNEEALNKLKETNGFCLICKKFFGITKLSLDHNPPLSKVPEGYVYHIESITFPCKPCNSRKYNKMDEETTIMLKKYLKEKKNEKNSTD